MGWVKSATASQGGACYSSETWVSLGVSRASVGLGVGFLDASSLTPVSLGLTHGWSSKEERVCAYYNYNLDIEREKKRDDKRRNEAYLRVIS